MKIGQLIRELEERMILYGNIDVCVDLKKGRMEIFTDEIVEISETTDIKDNVNGVCISNFRMGEYE